MDIHLKDPTLDVVLREWGISGINITSGECFMPDLKKTVEYLHSLKPFPPFEDEQEAFDEISFYENEISRIDYCVYNLLKGVPTLIKTLRFLYNEGDETTREKIRLSLDSIDLYGHLPTTD